MLVACPRDQNPPDQQHRRGGIAPERQYCITKTLQNPRRRGALHCSLVSQSPVARINLTNFTCNGLEGFVQT